MQCGHCAKKVENALKEISSIHKVKINLTKKEVTIISSTKIDNKQIQEKLDDLDYKIINITE